MKKAFILVVFLVMFSLVGCSGKGSEINKMIGDWDTNIGFTYTIAKENDYYSYTIKDTLGSTKITGGIYDEKNKTLVFSENEVEAQDCKFQYDTAKDELIQIDTDGTKRQLKRLGE